MTRVMVDPGICGFDAVIEVTGLPARKVRVVIKTQCEMVNAMNTELAELDWRQALGKPAESPVYIAAFRHMRHTGCPIPSAIIKAVEVEVGAALPKAVSIKFEHDLPLDKTSKSFIY